MTKQPPVTLRVPAETRAAVEKLATARGIPRNAAYVELIERGLKGAGAKALAGISKSDAPKVRAAVAIQRVPPAPTTWPSGALIEPHHTADPGIEAPGVTIVRTLQLGPKAYKPGDLAKKGKGK